MSYLYQTLFYQPLLNTLVFFYNTIALEDLGVAIVLLTILIRLILFPVFHKSVEHQMLMQEIQPKIKKIQEDHKGNYEKQTQAIMAVYRDHKVNPLSGFLLLLIQLPILFALYQIFLNIAKEENVLAGLYSFIASPPALNHAFLGLINLAKPNMVIVGLAVLTQYFQARLGLAQSPEARATPAARMSQKMVWLAPLITLAVLWGLPSAIGLYWFVTSLFSVAQQMVVNRKIRNGELGRTHKKTPRADRLR